MANNMVSITRLSALLLVGVAVSLNEAHAGSLKEASVTEAVNTVSYQSTADAPQKSAAIGTTIDPGNIVRTGVKSRAELQFNDNTITRIGANSAFSFDSDKQSMNLQEGTALFSKPKDNSTFEITTPAATCSISGTTGFMEVRPGAKGHDSFIFGLIEGHTAVNVGGKTYNVGAGQLLVRTLSGNVNFVAFNIPNFVAHAGLMKDFKSKLPNEAYINKAVAKFVSLQQRGFIEPTSISIAGTSNLIGFYANAAADFHQYNGINSQLTLAQQVATFQGQAAQFSSMQQTMTSSNGGGGFVNIGGSGVIHGQLIWNLPVDLDLHLILPGGAGEVYYANRTITFNGGAAVATLDHDNVGGAPDIAPNEYVENITVTGTPAAGAYQFYVHDFNSSGVTSPIAYTLTTTGNSGATQSVQTGTLTSGSNGPVALVNH